MNESQNNIEQDKFDKIIKILTILMTPINLLTSRIAKLIDVKSLVTLSMSACFVTLSLKSGKLGTELLSIFTMIVGFYFGTQKIMKEKQPNENENNDNK